MNKIICIGRQFGSGGHEIGIKTAQKLGIKIYEKDLLAIACKYGEVEQKALEKSDEKATNPYLFNTIHQGNYNVARGLPTSEVLFALQSHEITRIAKQESCIIVGRCAAFLLKDKDVKVLNVFVHAPLDFRIKRKMQQENLTQDKAKRLIKKMDKQRSKYYNHYTGEMWGNPDNYDYVIDSSTEDIDKAVDNLVAKYLAM